MNKWIFPLLIIFAFGCKKNTSVQNHSEDKVLIQNAKTYFEQAISRSGNEKTTSSNPRTSINKNPDWQDAYTIQLSFGKAVLVPVEYQQPFIFIKTNFGGETIHPLNQIVKLLVYNDSKGSNHIELITSFPTAIPKLKARRLSQG